MSGRRRALIVGTDRYDAPGFTQLAAPVHDAQALHDVLADPAIGGFEVTVLRSPTTQEARIAIEDFFVEVKRDDLLVLHFSCHGVKSAEGELYLAMRDTLPDRLAATGLPADFVNRLMAASRAQQIALFLDCCFGGAFHRGMQPRAAGSVNVKDAFQRQEGVRAGRARVVVTAAGDVQYALEGGRLVDRHDQPSVFTGVVVEALSTGNADRDGDGWVGIYELFDYVSDHVAELTTAQTPELSTFGTHGDMLLAHSQARLADPGPLDEELAALLASSLTTARLNGIAELRSRVVDVDLMRAAAAWRELERRSSGDESAAVRAAAAEGMAAATLEVAPGPVRLDADGAADVEIGGPPLARQVRADSDAPWLSVETLPDRVLLSTRADWAPGERATVTITGPTGSAELEVLPPAAPPPPPPGGSGGGRRRRPSAALAGVVAGAVAVVLVVAAVAVWLLDGDPDEASALPQGPALADDALVWTQVDGVDERVFAGVPGQGTALPLPGGVARWPTLTDDRRTVLYLSHDTDADLDTLWAAGSGGENPRQVIDDPSCRSAGRPSVSPDGRIAIACRQSSSDNENDPGIRIYSAAGTLLQTLDDSAPAGTPTWASDGRSVVYFRQNDATIGEDPGGNLFVVAVDDDAVPQPLTEGAVRDELPVVTPDRRTAVFVRRTAEVPDRVLYLVHLEVEGTTITADGSPEAMEVGGQPISGNQPTLSPDGSQLRYVKDGQVWAVPLDLAEAPAPVSGLSDVEYLAWARR